MTARLPSIWKPSRCCYWAPLVFARSTRGPLEGGFHVEVLPGMDAGVQLAYEQGRTTSESTFLSAHDLPNIGRGGSYGAHLEWNGKLGPAPINSILRYRQNLKAGQGLQADLRLTAGVFQARGFSAGVVGEATWADARSNRTMYGITASQAAISGLPAFSPGSGLLSGSLGLIWSFDLAEKASVSSLRARGRGHLWLSGGLEWAQPACSPSPWRRRG